jgi:LacI family transcriptional regulator
VRGIEEALWQAGLASLLADTDNDPGREATLLDELLARRCEGLMVLTATREDDAVRALAATDVPTVLVTRGVDDGSLPFVAGDDALGVTAAVEHLRELGHTRIAHLTGPLDLQTTVRRLEAFRAAMPDGLVHHGDGFTIEAGRALTAELLASGDGAGVTAVLAGNDMIALGCLEAFAGAGVRCPDDISLVGHNDMPMVDRVQPPLTTVSIPQREIGAEAAAILLTRLQRGGGAPERRLLPTRLVVRASTAPPRSG